MREQNICLKCYQPLELMSYFGKGFRSFHSHNRVCWSKGCKGASCQGWRSPQKVCHCSRSVCKHARLGAGVYIFPDFLILSLHGLNFSPVKRSQKGPDLDRAVLMKSWEKCHSVALHHLNFFPRWPFLE